MKEPTVDTSQVSAMLTGDETDRADKRWKGLGIRSRSTYIRAAIDFFNGQPDEEILYWMDKVHKERNAWIIPKT